MSWVSSPDASLVGGWLSSQYSGLGATGAVINAASSGGESGAGPLYGLGLSGASEYYWRVTTAPASGALVIYEDGTFSHTGAADGSWTWTANVYADGVLQWSLTVTGTFGTPTLSGNITLGGLSLTGALVGPTLNAADLDAIAQAVWSRVIEHGLTAEQMLRIALAALAGKANGIGTGTETYLGVDGTTTRIAAVFDSQGNRLDMTLNGVP